MKAINFALELPIDTSPEGKMSVLILKTIYEQEKDNTKHSNIFLFPTRKMDLSGLAPGNEFVHFQTWILHQYINGVENFNRNIPSFAVSDFCNCFSSVSKRQNVLSFHDTDSPTKSEINLTSQSRFFFHSRSSIKTFSDAGGKSEHLNLAFDSFHIKSQTMQTGNWRVIFNIIEDSKNKKSHIKAAQAWISKYGGNDDYKLQYFTNSQKADRESIDQTIKLIHKGKEKQSNVSVYLTQNRNKGINDVLNSADVIIGMSGESFSLSEFNSVAIGKHAVLLRANANKDWATDEMVSWVEPRGKIPVYDEHFFREGTPFNQGNIHDFNTEELLSACDSAILKVEKNKLNTPGLSLQASFSKEALVDKIIDILSV